MVAVSTTVELSWGCHEEQPSTKDSSPELQFSTLILPVVVFQFLNRVHSLWPHDSMPGFPVHHQLPELEQTHVHWVGDAIQPSHPLSPTSPPAFNLSQHQHLFQRVGSLHQVAKELNFQLQHQFFQWIFRVFAFRIYWFNLLAVQGTLKSLLQHHSWKALKEPLVKNKNQQDYTISL